METNSINTIEISTNWLGCFFKSGILKCSQIMQASITIDIMEVLN